jgi:two-component system invasion response regulator UvrY
MVSVLIIDEHVVFRRGLKQTLSDEIRDVSFCEAKGDAEAVEAVAKRPWDIVILSLTGGNGGFEVLRKIRMRRPETRVLVLSVHSDARYAAKAVQLGACGFISKSASLAELLKAVRSVLAGRRYLKQEVSEALAAGSSAVSVTGRPLHAALSRREREILLAIAAGQSIGEIAANLNLSIKTVSTYKRRLLNKLELHSTADLVRYVIDHDLS